MFGSSLAHIFIALAAASTAAAHGIIGSVSIDGRNYNGANGVRTSQDTPMRRVSTGSPIYNEYGNEIICGPNAGPARGVADANPGSRIQIFWTMENGGNWPHNTGPIISYLARCEGDCTTFRPNADTNWFKISQAGLKEPGVPDTWVQKDLMSGAPVTVVLPENLAPGGYLLRHEIIALHLAGNRGGAEFYPGCLQLRVGGNGNGVPDQTVKFPGAYYEDHPGLVGNFFAFGLNYQFPGGPIARLVGSAPEPTPTPAPSPQPAPSSSSPAPRPSVASSESTGSKGRCRVRKRNESTVTNSEIAGVNARRAISWHRSRRALKN